MGNADLTTVASYLHLGEAEVAKAALADSGVMAMVHQDDEGGLNPGFFNDYRVRLVVRSEDREAAVAVLGLEG